MNQYRVLHEDFKSCIELQEEPKNTALMTEHDESAFSALFHCHDYAHNLSFCFPYGPERGKESEKPYLWVCLERYIADHLIPNGKYVLFYNLLRCMEGSPEVEQSVLDKIKQIEETDRVFRAGWEKEITAKVQDTHKETILKAIQKCGLNEEEEKKLSQKVTLQLQEVIDEDLATMLNGKRFINAGPTADYRLVASVHDFVRERKDLTFSQAMTHFLNERQMYRVVVKSSSYSATIFRTTWTNLRADFEDSVEEIVGVDTGRKKRSRPRRQV